ncbi:type II toxin-antitoxin system HicA family toxin [Yersinia vastinensis]|uniref:type II toxin-antitoxin system HicA family toxin n=1 Tax=Yersinia vastinensis TaxID=2890318 RepID=UPI00384A96E4
MKQYGFSTLNGSGSKRKFINENKRIVALHCPHPGNIEKAYVLKEVKILLEELEAHE